MTNMTNNGVKLVMINTLHDGVGYLSAALEKNPIWKSFGGAFDGWLISSSPGTVFPDGFRDYRGTLRVNGAVCIDERAGFSQNNIRNNHYSLLDAARIIWPGDNVHFMYIDADRLVAEHYKDQSNLKRLGWQLKHSVADNDLDFLSIVRSFELETGPRKATEGPLNMILNRICGGVPVDSLGSYCLMSGRLVDQALKSNKEHDGRGLRFPATEWMLTAVEHGMSVGSFVQSLGMGGFEFDDYRWYLEDRRSLVKLAHDIYEWNLQHKSKMDISGWTSVLRELHEGRGKLSDLAVKLIFKDLYLRFNLDLQEWTKRLVTGHEILDFVLEKGRRGEIQLSEQSQKLIEFTNQHFNKMAEDIKLDIGPDEEIETVDRWGWQERHPLTGALSDFRDGLRRSTMSKLGLGDAAFLKRIKRDMGLVLPHMSYITPEARIAGFGAIYGPEGKVTNVVDTRRLRALEALGILSNGLEGVVDMGRKRYSAREIEG